jgi:RNA polymerase sigma-70 factor (ECF subfamily)
VTVAILDDSADNPLLGAYLERRELLVRYFRARLNSQEAAEDLVQEIFIKVRAYVGEPVANPGAFLYRMGTNLMLDAIKQRRRAERRDAEWRDAETDSTAGEDISRTVPADEAVSARQRLTLVIAAVSELPAPMREAFRLHKLEGLSHAETAKAMGVSRSSVEKYIMTCLKLILERVGR